jgi:hypothetical protein
MRNIFFSLCLAFGSVLFSSCDEIENPIITFPSIYNEAKYGPAPEFTTLENPTKNVFIEEFTGHLCGFCPPATALVKQLDEELGPRLIPLSVHAGTLAVVSNPPFDADYNTEVGDIYWAQLEGGFNPAARIDREGGLSNFYVDNAWEANINSALTQPANAALQIIADVVEEDAVVNIHVHHQFLNSLPGSYNLVVLLAESNIISPQIDYDQTPSEIEDYEHNHVLRDGVTGAAGIPIATDPAANSTGVTSFTKALKNSWVANNCTVIAFIIDNSTQEVVNAVEYELD